MSQENVEIARNAVAAFNRRDVRGPGRDDHGRLRVGDVDRDGRVHRLPRGGRARSYFRDADVWELLNLEVEEFRDLGDEVLVVGMFHARGGGSGVEIHAPYYSAFFTSGGKLARVLSYQTEDEALEAVGLSE